MSEAAPQPEKAFSVTTMLALVLVGVLCLAGIGLLSAFEPELKSGNDGQAHALSKSSVGYLALGRFLEKMYFDVRFDRKGIAEEENESTAIIAPNTSVDSERLTPFLRDGPTILILPKWLVTRDEDNRAWANLVSLVPKEDVLNLLTSDLRAKTKLIETDQPVRVNLTYRSPYNPDTTTQFGQSQPIKQLRSLSGGNWQPVLAGPNGTAIIAKHTEHNLYVVADPDILNNAGIANAANAQFLAYFITDISDEYGSIILDLTLNGFQRQPNLGRLLVQPPLLGATLCFVLASILVAIQAAIRFLPPLAAGRVVALGKSALADNTAGLVRMGKREHQMALPYANMIKRQVAKAVGAPTNLEPLAQTAMLDRMSELSQSQFRFSNLVADAAATPDPNALMTVAHNLHVWKQETTREHQ